MTTSLTSQPSRPKLSADGVNARTASFPSKMRSSRVVLFGIVAVVLLSLLAVSGWAVVRWRRASVAIASVDKFTVTPRTFQVVLKEKGELKAATSTDVKCEVEGRTTIISLVDEGKAVKKGDLLVELATDAIDDRIQKEELTETNAITAYEAAKSELDIQRDKNASDIRKAELEIELQRLELEKYRKGDWLQQQKDAAIAIDESRIMLDRRKEDFEAAKKLVARNFITQTEYEEDEFDFQKAQWELEKADRAKQVLESYTHIAALRRHESDLEEAIKEAERTRKNAQAEEAKKTRALEGKTKELELTQAQLAKLRAQRKKCKITAPTAGFVVYYSGGGRWYMGSETQMREGAEVRERQILMQLPDTSKMNVVVRVHEAKIDKLSVGQSATVKIEGVPGRQFTGKVTKIAVLADTQNRWLNPDLKEYETEITLDPTDVPLKPGATAHVEILVEKVEQKLAVPVQSVYTKGSQRYVFRQMGDKIQPVEIQVRAAGTEWAEVVDGLKAHEQILLAFSDDQERLVPDVAPPRGDGKRQGRRGQAGQRRHRPGSPGRPHRSGKHGAK